MSLKVTLFLSVSVSSKHIQSSVIVPAAWTYKFTRAFLGNSLRVGGLLSTMNTQYCSIGKTRWFWTWLVLELECHKSYCRFMQKITLDLKNLSWNASANCSRHQVFSDMQMLSKHYWRILNYSIMVEGMRIYLFSNMWIGPWRSVRRAFIASMFGCSKLEFCVSASAQSF